MISKQLNLFSQNKTVYVHVHGQHMYNVKVNVLPGKLLDSVMAMLFNDNPMPSDDDERSPLNNAATNENDTWDRYDREHGSLHPNNRHL